MPRREIFIADDDRLLCELVADALRGDGHHSALAHDGVRALAALRRRSPDLLILDANMPVMDGFELLAELKADPLLRTIPVLMLTGLRGEKDVRRALALGAAAYVVKPFVVPALLARAYALVDAGRSAPAAAPPELVPQPGNMEWID